jgi:glycosyltransferase involved in cell wall biosynthesis
VNKKKVLIICYYWPPSGGSGVQRWLKFVKYLPQFGVKPYVFTPANPSFAIKDESLQNDIPAEAEVVHFPIWEPYDLFFKLSGGKKNKNKPTDFVSTKKKSFFKILSTWVRGNFFIPDPRVFWVRPASTFLERFIREHDIKTVITTGPPHSVHLIGCRLKKKLPDIKWLADFRDPWSEWGFLDSLMVGALARKIHQRLEQKVLSTADTIITITPFYVEQFARLAQRNVALLTNGFDENDFTDLDYRKNKKFLIRHVGIINEKCNPRPFLDAVRELMKTNTAFSDAVLIEFIGEVHSQVKEYIYDSPELRRAVTFTNTIPHKELLKLYGESSLLLLILTGYKDAEGYMPGKLFEYLATGLPIFAVGPSTGNAAALLQEIDAGTMLNSDDYKGMIITLNGKFEQWQNAQEPVVHNTRALNYSRRAIAGKLAEMI